MIAAALLNYAVNPLGVFAHGEIPGMHGVRNRTANEHIPKYYYASRIHPHVLIMGTSRMGAFQAAAFSKYTNGRVYNLSIRGASIMESSYYIDYFAREHPVHTIVIGLDFLSFNPLRNITAWQSKEGFEPGRLTKGIFINDYLVSTLSINTVARSVKTLIDNLRGKSSDYEFSEGFTTWTTELNEIEAKGIPHITARIKGHLKGYILYPDLYGNPDLRTPSSIDNGLSYLEDIVQTCNSHGITLHAFISPIRPEQLDLIYALGLGGTFEHWKIRVADTLGSAYDFTPKSSFSHEASWWIDSSHIQPKAVPLVLARIFGDTTMDVPADFGLLLTPETVAGINRSVRESIEPMDLSEFEH